MKLKKALQKTKKLTQIDIKNKSIFELTMSAVEELGEFSRELKIEEKTFGNTYKKPDEGTKKEAVDLVISALALYFARGGKISELATNMKEKLKKWEDNTHK